MTVRSEIETRKKAKIITFKAMRKRAGLLERSRILAPQIKSITIIYLRQVLEVLMPQLEKNMAIITQTPSIAVRMLIMRPVIRVKLRLVINNSLANLTLSVAMTRSKRALSLTIITMVTLKTMAQLIIVKTLLYKEQILRSVAKTLISNHLLSKVIWHGNIKR